MLTYQDELAAERLADKLVGYDDEIIAAAFQILADKYKATFRSIKRELSTAEQAQQYREASKGG